MNKYEGLDPALAEMLENMETEGGTVNNLYAMFGAEGFKIATIDNNKLVVSHDGRVMNFYDPEGVVIYTIDSASEQDVADSDIDMLMDVAWGDGFNESLHEVLHAVGMVANEVMGNLGDGEG